MRVLTLAVIASFFVTASAYADLSGLGNQIKGAATDAANQTTGAAKDVVKGKVPGTKGVSVGPKTCDLTRGEINGNIGTVVYQPDKLNNAKFASKAKIMPILTAEGFTCVKSKQPSPDHDSTQVCNREYKGMDPGYKWIQLKLKCKGDKCDEPNLTCSENKNLE